jgi:hypothetical protein
MIGCVMSVVVPLFLSGDRIYRIRDRAEARAQADGNRRPGMMRLDREGRAGLAAEATLLTGGPFTQAILALLVRLTQRTTAYEVSERDVALPRTLVIRFGAVADANAPPIWRLASAGTIPGDGGRRERGACGARGDHRERGAERAGRARSARRCWRVTAQRRGCGHSPRKRNAPHARPWIASNSRRCFGPYHKFSSRRLPNEQA